MEEFLRLGLLSLAVVIFVLIFIESRLRRKRFKLAELSTLQFNSPSSRRAENVEPSCSFKIPPTENVAPAVTVAKEEVIKPANNLLVMSIFAKPNSHFASYDLLQSIFATGMQFGEMNIFHYYQETDEGRIALFSLASATKPGDFNLDKMGDFSCKGLTLFMDLSTVKDAEFAFNRMFEVAEQLAEDLDGDLYAGPRKPWTAEILQQYRQQIKQHQVALS